MTRKKIMTIIIRTESMREKRGEGTKVRKEKKDSIYI